MYLVAIGWMYVVLMMTVAEAMSPQGTLLGAVFTFLLYGCLPLAVVLYLLGTPARRRARRAAEHAPGASPGEAPAGALSSPTATPVATPGSASGLGEPPAPR